MSELFPVLWDDRTESCHPQRHLVQVGIAPEFLLVDGTPTDLTKVMGPLSYEEGVRFAEKLLRDGIASESDMARALCVCMVLVGCTRPVLEGGKERLMRVPEELRQRRDAARGEAETGEAA